MAIPGEFVLQNHMMTSSVYMRQPELIPYAQRMLMVTRHFAREVPTNAIFDIWSRQPTDTADAAAAQTCSKTGLLVPLHMQATFRGAIYDRRWVPQGSPDDKWPIDLPPRVDDAGF